jgi:hypothetical protein
MTIKVEARDLKSIIKQSEGNINFHNVNIKAINYNFLEYVDSKMLWHVPTIFIKL